MGSEQAPKADYKAVGNSISGAANGQLRNNRLNTSNPFSSQTFNEDGSVSSQLNGDLGQAASRLMGQAGDLGTPMDWDQFGTPGTGDDARKQAFDSAYGQYESRLNPMWDKRESNLEARLLNQGLDPGSKAYQDAKLKFGQDRTDAFQTALNSAVGQSTAAGDSVFRNNMASRTQQIAEALQERGMPLQELGQLQKFLGGQPQYNADQSSLTGALGAAPWLAKEDEQAKEEFLRQQQANSDTAAGIMSGVGTAAGIAAMFF